LKNNGITFIDLFCGCGGITQGFTEQGFELISGIDNEEPMIETYNQNFDGKGIVKDLIEYEPIKFAKTLNLDKNSIDVIVGGPPCQGFSMANMWDKEKNDPRNNLFNNFVDYILYFEPEVFMMENVKGILSAKKRSIKSAIADKLKNKDYIIHDPKILNASDYGVPQNRERVFFIGTKKGLNFKYPSRQEEKITVKDALSDLYKYEGKNNDDPVKYKRKPLSKFQEHMRKSATMLFNHEPRMPAESTQQKIREVPQGGNWKDIPEHFFNNNRKNRHSSAFKRLSEKDQSITIDTGNAHSNYFHPKHNRIPSVREAARLQSFPDRFIFCGSRTQQYRQVGNAVPPKLAESLAVEISKAINNK